MTDQPFTLASLNPTPPKRRRPWLWPALAAVALLLLGGGVIVAVLTAGRAPDPSTGTVTVTTAAGTPTPATTSASPASASATDPAGRAACAAAKQWQDAGMADITQALVEQIHGSAIKSTVPDVVYRANALYDTWNRTQVQVKTQELSGPEVQLRLMGPMIEFETACVNARYT